MVTTRYMIIWLLIISLIGTANADATGSNNITTENKTYSEVAACFENYDIAKDTVIFLYSQRCSHCAIAKPQEQATYFWRHYNF